MNSESTLKKLDIVDIVISIFNQEHLIERVLFGVFHNTTTPFNLILVFDGCTDKTKPVALKFIEEHKPDLMRNLITDDAPNVFETRANNIGFKHANEDYMITIQDDMVIKEYGWERRLTYPLRKFDDILAISSRHAQDIEKIGNGTEEYTNRSARELGTLDRNTLAIRDVINRGPIAFNMRHLRELNYLNEKYAPCNLDDADISLRAWTQRKWKVGAYWIDFISRPEWAKSRAKDSTMGYSASEIKNQDNIAHDHGAYLLQKEKHSEDIIIPEKEVDFVRRNNIFKYVKFLFFMFTHTPTKSKLNIIMSSLVGLSRMIKKICKGWVITLMILIGFKDVERIGIKKALLKRK